MKIKRILKKQLATLPCKFILGCIGQKSELTPIKNDLIRSIEKHIGNITDILSVKDFPNPPINYFNEMGQVPLSTTIFLLENGGAYTDLHHLKKKTDKIENEFLNESGRIFNINPGAIGRYGICLASHKPTGGRPSLSVYAYGFHPHLFFGGESYYERISKWNGNQMELLDYIVKEKKFSEYHEPDRIKVFEGLTKSLKKSEIPIELLN